MSDSSKLKNLLIRAASAIVALLMLAFMVWQWGPTALQILCTLAVILGTRELNRILFEPEDSFFIKSLFFILMLSVFLATSTSLIFSALAFAFISILFFSFSLWFARRFKDLSALLRFQAKVVLGFLYLGLLPGFAVQITFLPDGLEWFLAMLGIVFAGDTCAYLTGILFGKTPLMPAISPKKTIEGSLGGLIGSVLAGAVFVSLKPGLPLLPVLILAALSGFAGQMGDLFESLLKRVANQKDSGSLMPGHGGVLDRIDGVLFASPVILAGAMIIEISFGTLPLR